MRQRPSNIVLFLLLSIMLICQPSFAGKVFKVKSKGKKILIKLSADEAEDIAIGDRLYLTTSAGKKKALVIIRKKKGRNVIAQLKKGKARKGMLTRLKKSKRKKMEDAGYEDASEVAQNEDDSSPRNSDLMFGLMGGFGSATQSVADVSDMSGSTLAVKALVDYSLFGDLGIRARVGLDMLSLTGDGLGTNLGNSYTTDINYLTVDLMLRYNVFKISSVDIFVNGGMGIYSPMSNELGTPAALDEASISTTSLLIFGLGASLPVGSWQIFAGADYFHFTASEQVKTSAFAAKIGVLFPL